MVSQDVGIAAAFAGPSEIAVIADETANPKFAAIDLMVQAEHGPDGQAWLMSTDEKILEAILQELEILVNNQRDDKKLCQHLMRAVLLYS